MAVSPTDPDPPAAAGVGEKRAGDVLSPALPSTAATVAGDEVAAQGDRRRTGASLRRQARIRWWVELLAVAWLALIYDFVNNLAPLRLGPALTHGKDILRAETKLGISPELSLDRWLSGKHTLGLWVSYYYDNAHFIVTFALLGYLWWRRGDIYRPLRTSLVLINVAGFIIFWLYPVAPPRMLDGFTDVVQASGVYGSWHSGALASDANQLAAMPSLHIAWALWCSVAIWRITKRPALRAIAVVYPFVTAFAVLATGNHYLFDMLAGAVLAVAVLSAVAFAPKTRLAGWAAGLRPRQAVT
jgi:PAP2 superfamily